MFDRIDAEPGKDWGRCEIGHGHEGHCTERATVQAVNRKTGMPVWFICREHAADMFIAQRAFSAGRRLSRRGL